MKIAKEILKGTAESIVLQTLNEEGDLYGYELIKRISEKSKNIFEFQEGTLYPLLYRLELKGFVTSYKKNAPSGKERRYYKITEAGLEELGLQKSELANYTQGLKYVFNFSG